MPDTIGIISRPAAAGEPPPIRGATKANCAKCGCQVWVSPYMQQKAKDFEKEGQAVTFQCIHCANPKPDDEFRPLAPEQLEELRQAGATEEDILGILKIVAARDLKTIRDGYDLRTGHHGS